MLTPVAIVAAYFAAFVSFRSEPSGYVTAYSVIGHARTDIFDFHAGTVTIRTCCGDLPAGTYARTPEGDWLWQFRYGEDRLDDGDFIVRPNLFSMHFTDARAPSKTFTLRRRVLTQLPL